LRKEEKRKKNCFLKKKQKPPTNSMTTYTTPGQDFFKRIRTYNPNSSILKPQPGPFDSNKSSKVSTHPLSQSIRDIGKRAYGVTPNVEMEYNFNLSAKNLDLLELKPNSDTRLKDIVDCKPLDNEYVFKMIHYPLSSYSSKKFKNMHLNIYALNSYLKFLYHEKALPHLHSQRKKKYGNSKFWEDYDLWKNDKENLLKKDVNDTTIIGFKKDKAKRKLEWFNRDEYNGRTILKYIIEGGYIEDYVKQIYSKNKLPKSKGEEINEYIIDVAVLASTVEGALKLFQPFGIIHSQTEYIHPYNKWEEFNRRRSTARDDYLSVQTFGRMRTFPLFSKAIHGDFIAVYIIQIDCGPVQFFFYKSMDDIMYLKFLFLYGNSKRAGIEYDDWKRVDKMRMSGGGGGQMNPGDKHDGVISVIDDDDDDEEVEEDYDDLEREDDDDVEEIQIDENPQVQLDIDGKSKSKPEMSPTDLCYKQTKEKLEKIVIKKIRNVFEIRMDEKEKYEDFQEVEMIKNQGVCLNFESNLYYSYPERVSKIVCTEKKKKMTQQVALIDVDVILL